MYKVLIVDDDRAVLYMLKRFKNWDVCGFEIGDDARDGKEAIKKLEPGRFDLVITDIKMPGMDGIEFLQELKRMKRDTCVIFLSTHSDFEYAKQGIRLGVFDYMTKPVDEAVLAEVLERTRGHLDEKKRQKLKAEEDRKLIEESLHVYYPKNREKQLISLLMAGEEGLMEEAERTFRDFAEAFGNELPKLGLLLETVLVKLSEMLHASHPWLEKIEKVSFEDIKNNFGPLRALKEKFLSHVKEMLETVKKYELHQADSTVRKTCEYVLNHVEEEIKLENIAQEIHLRSDYIGKLFKRKTGCNLNDYITRIKMEHAKYLLSTGDFKNYELSEKLGYSSTDYFCRLFKNYTGHTPVEYKKTAN